MAERAALGQVQEHGIGPVRLMVAFYFDGREDL